MNDIARAAGVGKATVSLALRDDPRLRLETRQRIQAIARQMDYRPNATVRHLMAQLRASRTPKFQATLALLNASTDSALLEDLPTFRSWVKGCGARSRELGYGLDYFWLNEPDISVERFAQILESRDIRGVIVTGLLHHGTLPEAFASIWPNYACVAIGVRPTPALHFACNDQYLTALETVRELKKLGYRHPGLVLNAQVDQNVDRRFSAGFQAGIEPRDTSARSIPPFDFDPNRFREFRDWLEKYHPDAIVCIHAEVRNWLQELGRTAPKNIGLAHLDLTEKLEGWTGMTQNSELIGSAAVDIVVSQLHRNESGIPAFPKCVLIGSTWDRGTTVRSAGQGRSRAK